MSVSSVETTIRTLDGLHLRGTLVSPDASTDHSIVLVHGGGVTRDEGGFFTRLATGLAEAGVAALRYDLRGHGESDGAQQDATLAGHLNDISVALQHIHEMTGATRGSLLGTSFGGGLAAYYAGSRPTELDRLVLLNPQLDYQNRYIEQKPHWDGHRLNDEMATRLAEHGFVAHSPTVKHGRAFLNEVFWIRPLDALDKITAPTLLVHGTKDTFVPVDVSRTADQQIRGEHRLVEIEGAQHGFAVHDDPTYANPQTQVWQRFVIDTVCGWVTA